MVYSTVPDGGWEVAVGETAILLHSPLLLAGVSTGMERERQQKPTELSPMASWEAGQPAHVDRCGSIVAPASPIISASLLSTLCFMRSCLSSPSAHLFSPLSRLRSRVHFPSPLFPLLCIPTGPHTHVATHVSTVSIEGHHLGACVALQREG